MIVLENVVKSYPNGVGAINGISMNIKRGEFVFIVGDSGSGKSTLIKLLLKELEPTEGRIRVNGVNLARMRKRAIPRYRRKIGCVFQDQAQENPEIQKESGDRVSGFPPSEGPECL